MGLNNRAYTVEVLENGKVAKSYGPFIGSQQTRDMAESISQANPYCDIAMRKCRRASPQPPISAPRYKVMYLVDGKERQSAWLYSEAHAQKGLAMMQAKYGERNAIIYVD
ncbi:MAG: hypothetical protein CL547_03075 [Alcanivorax sp.]|nr:hypothetical protein [Alcanivorax sp.]|tara:strand:+ start:327 stop:656 length:330 start_codon:yes stop_codon:yes gene_type:complete